MRQVDADAFKAEGRKLYRDAGWDLRDVHYSQMDVECNIDMMPTIEAEPIKHGRWIVLHGVLAGDDIYGDMGECSNCGLHLRNYEWNYCPNCGARMDEVEE